MSHLEYSLLGIEAPDLSQLAPCDVEQCSFGKWLASVGNDYKDLKHFPVVVDAHNRFHHHACELGHIFKRENVDAARHHFNTTLTLSSKDLGEALVLLKIDRRIQLDIQEIRRAEIAANFPNELLLGIPEIDQQHIELNSLTHRLLSNPKERIYAETTSELTSTLTQMFIAHFKTEEDYMRAQGKVASYLDQHIAHHAQFLDELVNFQFQSMSHEALTAADVYEKLMGWELSHMQTDDVHLVRHAQ